MRSVRQLTPLVLAILCVLSGCYHYGYSPYGGGGYPGPASYPMSPGGGGTYMSPSTPYAPYNSTSPGMGPTPIAPNGTTTQPGTIPWRNEPNGVAPGNPARPYEPNPADRLVPDPRDPNPADSNQPFGPDPSGTSITPPFSPFASGSGVQLQTIEPGPALSPGAAIPGGTVVSSDPFESPMRSVSNGSTVAARPSKLSADGRQPFGYDARNYTWLRGYIDFDPKDQRWIMIYSATPESSDRFGGSLTLHDHKLLSKVKPQDHVFIDGTLDEASFDLHGKPLYRIASMKRLQ